ncbi:MULTISPECIES: ATP-dependent RNA helicase HrpA [Nocardiopsis]|uniref:RNA helicase n=1 Tax=Nocardiopsis alba TaxID=53437 RepID=A0A7K2IVU4_9ACTN|nr:MULTISPECIES: ATP-dependent RNA helicase HrpA [Nocardiopsis]MEC3894294.1 ATP-dependent RNA helicase HrpA [Nocardiopsis sp. LDBS1602]MYR34081.1 ATP-dependent RNA helicase HrpA [Nocardiopsis alba]
MSTTTPARSSAHTSSSDADPLRSRLRGLMPADRHRLRRRIDGLAKIRDERRRASVRNDIAEDIDRARVRVESRRESVPELHYPEALPVSARREDIAEAIRDHQVVIVAGETGSGKTTQLPKICLELGRGVMGTVGHTQPRRLAARTVAERIADEIGTPLGETVGYKVRFTDSSGDNTLVKLMTDGILLAEIQHDRMLRQYDTLIIDEAHERSLNIDFLLGYLKQLLPKRPDLKVIITSATIDPERFSRHFDDAPIVEVSGRTYPVEVRYRPITDEILDPDEKNPGGGTDKDQTQAILEAVDELSGEAPGDILVFLSGEREIRDTAEALEKKRLRGTEILPLYARLSVAEQRRVWSSHGGRRIVLATNVAETSLTVPGIKYVIDPGTARISRYSHRTKVQRLPIEAISQASANQRKGRCGRVSEGICIRLYSEEDFLSRPEYTDPEILRTNLASVILQMASLGLGDVAAFPFVDGPDHRQIKDGVNLLTELGALHPEPAGGQGRKRRLTPTGRRLAQLPIDPRLGRMVLEAEKRDCLAEVMVITSALSIQDPRERPTEKQQQAQQAHARFVDKESDFLAFLNLWNHLRERQRELSGNRFRKECREEFLNYLRVREWQDIHSQLKQVLRQMDIEVPPLREEAADPRAVHMSLLAGLLSHVGLKDPEKHEYLGGRGARFAIFPGSALFKKQPRYVMAAELVETSKLWGRMVARIEPEWAEELGADIVKRSYSEPHWERKRGAVMAFERVTLYGVPIVVQRKVSYGRIDPELSRELFIRRALVEGDWETRHRFFHENRRLLDEVEDLEHRARRRDIVVDDDTLFDFYDRRVDESAISAAHFDSWWKKAHRADPKLLDFTREELINDGVDVVSEDDYPDTWRQGSFVFPLTYQFEPGSDSDGVTAHIPVKFLNQVENTGFDWQIPGLRDELITAMIRSLPKPLRRNFVPVPDHAARARGALVPYEGSLTEALAAELTRMAYGERVRAEDFQLDRVPDHLRITFRAVDDRKRTLAESKDLEGLRAALKPRLREAIATEAKGVERKGITSWDFGPLERTLERKALGPKVKGYPALVDEGESVAIRIFDTRPEQRAAMRAGTRRLLMLTIPSPATVVSKGLNNPDKLALADNPHGSIKKMLADAEAAAVDHLLTREGGPVWNGEDFARLADRIRADLGDTLAEVLDKVARVLVLWRKVSKKIKGTTSLAVLPSLNDVQGQLAGLVGDGFITRAGLSRLDDLHRYLRGIEYRLGKLAENPRRDQVNMAKVEQMRQAVTKVRGVLKAGRAEDPDVVELGWMLEEYRVSLFAQELRTAYPVSDKRIMKALEAVKTADGK